jgi:hypothetical protein
MGNLIIKGKGGAGNKLILQDQAGGAVLTTADSGATISNATLTSGNLSNSAIVYPAGHIIQVVGSDKSDTASVSSSTWTDITGTDNAGSGSIFCCKITPRSASSKILVSGTFNMGQQDGNNAGALRFLRDSTVIGVGDAAGNRTRAFIHLYLQNAGHTMASVSPNFLDSPNTTSEITYKAQFKSEGGSYSTHINRSHTDTNALVNGSRGFSNFLLMEIAG